MSATAAVAASGLPELTQAQKKQIEQMIRAANAHEKAVTQQKAMDALRVQNPAMAKHLVKAQIAAEQPALVSPLQAQLALNKLHAEQTKTQAQTSLANIAMMRAIYTYDDAALEAALKNGADPNLVGIKWDLNRPATTSSPLHKAIAVDNASAVSRLVTLPGVDLFSLNETNCPPIISAITLGNPQIVESLLKANPKLIDETDNSFDGDDVEGTLLHKAIFTFASRSILKGEFGNETLRGKYIDHFNEEGGIPDEKPAVVIYKGNLLVANILLKYSPRLALSKAKMGFNPMELVQNPAAYKHLFTDCTGVRPLPCVAVEKNALTFTITMCDQKGGNEYPLTVKLDFTELRVLLERTAKLLAADDEKLRSEVECIKAVTAPVVAEHYSALLQKADRLMVDTYPAAKEFYTGYNNKFRATLLDSSVLAGGCVERARNTAADYAAKGVTALTDNIPIISALGLKTIGAVIAAGIQALADLYQQKKHLEIAKLFDSVHEHDTLSNEVALELTKQCEFLKHKGFITDSDAYKLGEKLADVSYLLISGIKALNEKAKKARMPEITKADFKGLILKEIFGSGILDPYFAKYRKVASDSPAVVSVAAASAVFVPGYVAGRQNGAAGSKPIVISVDASKVTGAAERTRDDSPTSSGNSTPVQLTPSGTPPKPATAVSANSNSCICM